MNTRLKPTNWAVGILTILVTLAFVPSAIMKMIHHPTVVEGFSRIGIPPGAMTVLGIVELACLFVYLIPRTVVFGALLLTGYLGGATLANIITRSDFIHALVVGLLVWMGAWLRVDELRTLIPIRRKREAKGAGDDPAASRRAADRQSERGPYPSPTQ